MVCCCSISFCSSWWRAMQRTASLIKRPCREASAGTSGARVSIFSVQGGSSGYEPMCSFDFIRLLGDSGLLVSGWHSGRHHSGLQTASFRHDCFCAIAESVGGSRLRTRNPTLYGHALRIQTPSGLTVQAQPRTYEVGSGVL